MRPPSATTRMSRGKQRVVADRQQILAAAREIGKRDGWKSVTIRALGLRLGYAAPVLYEHFQNKQDVLTQIAVEGVNALHRDLLRPTDPRGEETILVMAERYWRYMLEQSQTYRLMNGMGDAPVDGSALAQAAQKICDLTGEALQLWFAAHGAEFTEVDELADTVWALLHGMASLYLGRAASFTEQQAKSAVLRLLLGALPQAASPQSIASRAARPEVPG